VDRTAPGDILETVDKCAGALPAGAAERILTCGRRQHRGIAGKLLGQTLERDREETVCICALFLGAGGDAFAGAGPGTFRDVRADPRGRDEPFKNNVDHSRGRGRVRPATDGHAEFEGGRRLGNKNHDVVGTLEHTPGAVDVSAAERRDAGAGLGKHGAFGGGSHALPRAIDGEAAGVDTEHERSRHRASCPARSARTSAANGRRIQLFWKCVATTGAEMGGTADAGSRKARGAETADTG